MIRFIISIFRVYSTTYSFVVVEIICLILNVIGIKLITKKENVF